MYVETAGPDDAPDLVLLHGGIGTGRYHWSKQVEALSAHFHVHMPDLPGHGRTSLEEGADYTRELLRDAVIGLLEELRAPVHVAGFSMGGHTSLAVAEQDPALFASLVLIGVSIREHEGLRGWRELFHPDELERVYPLWARQLSRLHEPLGGPDAWRDVCLRDSKGLEIDVDVDALAGLEAPVMLMRGDRDSVVDPGQYAELRQAWPQADEFVVPGGAHDVQLTRADVVRPVLLDFFRRALEDS